MNYHSAELATVKRGQFAEAEVHLQVSILRGFEQFTQIRWC
jgi:hypothetical protein